jgi:hypothetical protein
MYIPMKSANNYRLHVEIKKIIVLKVFQKVPNLEMLTIKYNPLVKLSDLNFEFVDISSELNFH